MDEINTYEEPTNIGASQPQGSSHSEAPTFNIGTGRLQGINHSQPTALNAEWLASLSHELRSPLTAIQGYASILLRHQDRISPEERQEFHQAIFDSSKRMVSDLDRFLDIANLESGLVQLHPLPVDIGQLVQEVILVEQQVCPDNNVPLTLKQEIDPSPLEEEEPHQFVINADATLIRKMLIQLLDNAKKYSAPCTPIEITLSCTSLGQRLTQIPPNMRTQMFADNGLEQTLVELSIQDHGIGIPIADCESIFERFERVNMQLTREVTGMGLGLTMCKHIVALHHGAIWVESTLGEGSTFHVLFPTENHYI